jgi:hypothetical protein
MATDNSPPKIRVILTIAFSSVVILGALNFVFQSYFQMMTDEAEHARLRPAAELIKLREGEQKNLSSGAMPIDKAIAELAAKGRESQALSDIAPQQSNDLGPMVGWIRTPNQAVIDAITAAANAPDAGAAPEATTDGGAVTDGAAVKGDAGPTTTAPAATDAGVPPKPSPDAGAAPTPKEPGQH